MNTELDLGLKTSASAVSPDEVETVVAVLATAPARGWMTAHEIAAALNKDQPSFERRVRAIASAAAPEIVSYPGSPGYKLWDRCSVEEIDHAINAFETQGKDMIKRAHIYRLAYHRRHRNRAAGVVQASFL